MIVTVLAFICLSGGLFILIRSLAKGAKGIDWNHRYTPNLIRAIVVILAVIYFLLTYKH